MALNIFPRRKESDATLPAPQPEPKIEPPPEPEPVIGQADTAAPGDSADALKKRQRRGSRGGRGRRRPGEAAAPPEEREPEPVAAPEVVSPRARRPRAPRVAATLAETPTAPAVAEPPDAAPPAPRTRARRTPVIPADAPAPEGVTGLARAVEQQGRQIEQLVRLQEDVARRLPAAGVSVTQPARVGVFVDTANIELGVERVRARIDWGKVLAMLTRDRRLVRAIAYSPVHDDPGVSIETQRFVEPFLDKGYKVVTKPLKRFADGTIKANVDIEMALDIVTMLDRLDVVCLVSGDGDFQRLVEVVQSRGVRVEVVAVGSSTAGSLRHAADRFIDLQAIMRDIRV